MHGADGLQAFLVIFDPTLSSQAQRITENPDSQFRRDLVMPALIAEFSTSSHVKRISIITIM